MKHKKSLVHSVPASSASRSLPFYLYDFLKTFLFRIYSGTLEIPDFKVIRMGAREDQFTLRPKPVTITNEPGMPHCRVSDYLVDATVSFMDDTYDLALTRERSHDIVSNDLFILGTNPGANVPDELAEFLKREAVNTSPYRNSALETAPAANDWDDLYVRPVDLQAESLDAVFLPQETKEQIRLFIHALQNHRELKKPLRYLFAGRPGTGKTRIIKAIATECGDDATFIFTNGAEERIDALFEFVKLFRPIVLCVDDIDLMTGSRDEGLYTKRLAVFLQRLDGFVDRDFFMLATTNDKRLVDLAASRPGRFDLIIDVNHIHPREYLSLVASKTAEEAVVHLFDEEVLLRLERKHVTGAFIANLVKHLELLQAFEPDRLTQEYLLAMIDETYRGFYSPYQGVSGALWIQFCLARKP